MYTVGSLFTGVGMFDLGFAWAGFRVRWQVEFDAWCQELLRARGNLFDHPAVYGDVRDVGAGRQHEPGYADVLIGGFPCQPFSLAGKRKGADDNRNMWPEFARIIGDVRPRAVVLENVPAICNPITAADGSQQPAYALTVIGDLSEMGYDATWGIIRASDTGAVHQRARWWLAAYDASDRHERAQAASGYRTDQHGNIQTPDKSGATRFAVERNGEAVEHANGKRRAQNDDINIRSGENFTNGGDDPAGMADAQRPRLEGAHRGQPQQPRVAGRRRRLHQPRLVRDADGATYRLDEPRYPAGMGSEQHAYEPPRTAAKVPHQRERTKALGNGLSPQISYALAVGVRAELERRDREETS